MNHHQVKMMWTELGFPRSRISALEAGLINGSRTATLLGVGLLSLRIPQLIAYRTSAPCRPIELPLGSVECSEIKPEKENPKASSRHMIYRGAYTMCPRSIYRMEVYFLGSARPQSTAHKEKHAAVSGKASQVNR